MKNFSSMHYYISILILLFLSSCKKDYIIYYNKVNDIDSTYRLANNPKLAIKEYRDLFKEYEPKNQDRIQEYTTYITLADQYNEDFGGKKSLYKLIPLIAPYDNLYKKYLPLFKKYGIDNKSVEQEIVAWKKKLNKQLIDSFTIAFTRDQAGRPEDTVLIRKNVEKNAKLFMWVFKKYGFPSVQKMGLIGNNGNGFYIPTMITHMNESKNHYPYIKEKLLEYIKSGDFSPHDYALMDDAYMGIHKKSTLYGFNFIPVKDSAQINRNRKSIGIPSMKHSVKIRKDFYKKLKQDDTHNLQ
jgi:hypothetical protein